MATAKKRQPVKGGAVKTETSETPRRSNQKQDISNAAKEAEAVELVMRINRDGREAARLLSREEIRFQANEYFRNQRKRVALQTATLAAAKRGTPHSLLLFQLNQAKVIEATSLNILKEYVFGSTHPAMIWMRSIYGVGPVIAATLFASIDIERATNCSKIWRFCGLDPTIEWKKGQIRPYSSHLKKICWYLGNAIVKAKNRVEGGTFYGNLYDMRRAYENDMNERGMYADQAKHMLETKYAKSAARDSAVLAKMTAAEIAAEEKARSKAIVLLKQGKLPPHGIQLRCLRWVVKMFLSHLYQVWREAEGLRIGDPYIIAIGGHSDFTAPPNPEKKDFVGEVEDISDEDHEATVSDE